MSHDQVRRTEARVVERERHRKQSEQKQTLLRLFPYAIIGFLAMVGVSLVAFGGSGATGASGPHLQVDREEVDLGDRHFDTTVRAAFKISNTGDSTLDLTAPQVATVVEGC